MVNLGLWAEAISGIDDDVRGLSVGHGNEVDGDDMVKVAGLGNVATVFLLLRV